MVATPHIVVGANAGRARSHNRQVILDRVRTSGRIGRAEMARATGLSTQAVSNIIADLLEEGLIEESGRESAGRGLPAVQYALNAQGGYALGVEIRPDAVFAALLDLRGETLLSRRVALAHTDLERVTQTVTTLRDRLVTEANVAPHRLLGAGIVMPGPFGTTGLNTTETELPLWGDASPQNWFSNALDLPTVIENDANAAAIAERIAGTASDLDTYAFLYFGNGVGLGIVQNGRLITGAHGNAGEIGHICVPAGGEIVPLESRVSRVSLRHALAPRKVESVIDLERLYTARTPDLMHWLDDAEEPLAAAITLVENLFDPATVILGGAMPDKILDHLIAQLSLSPHSVANRADRTMPRLMRGASGRMTATLGAAALVLNQAFTPKIAAPA